MQKMVISYALDKMQSRSISFEEQMYPLRLRLAAELEREQNWLQAARVLSQIPLESGQKQYTKENKMDLYLQIGRLFLEAEEFTEAENYIHRLGLLIDSAASEEIRSSLQHLKHKHLVEVAKSSMDRLIVSLGKPCDLTEQFAKVMDLIRGLPDNHAKEECLEHFLNTILRESFNVISARQYLEEFATSVYDLDAETRKSVLKYALSKSTSAFKEQMFKLQLLLADVLEDEQNWREAAYVLVLTEFPEQPVLERIKLYRRKVRLLLAGGDFGLAESCNATLGLLLQGDPTIPEEFRAFHATSFASIQNFKRQNNN
ncbi:uncharacterized protein LOC129583975 [Paramacrobiotus metropolitanus]|uniref:uncharacterized protein LOC129583975 n=1 Tax=Paramacrobiotus metropolitanus TaxID=2943436 RepID=UPI00244596C6|nr:uncharacterized protein LOC129583975 [Paramacrobiotus metropolitanus]